MNYIYDITLNLNKNNLYEFYEWIDEDNPEFILKIPVFKVDNDTFLDFKYNNAMVTKEFLEKIEDKTECYSKDNISIIRYACLLESSNNIIGIEFDSEGNNYMKSNISIDEELEIFEVTDNIKYSLIDYKVKKQNKIENKILTRKEKEREKELLKKLEYIKNNNEYSKLKYIFYEIYNQKLDDIDKIYNKLINIAKNNDSKFDKLNEIINLSDNKKIMSNNS